MTRLIIAVAAIRLLIMSPDSGIGGPVAAAPAAAAAFA